MAEASVAPSSSVRRAIIARSKKSFMRLFACPSITMAWRGSAVGPGSMHRGWRSLRHRLQVGLHDSFDTIDLCEMAQFSHGDLAAAPGLSQCLQCHVEANLVAKLEAVGHRLGRAVHTDGGSVVGYRLDTIVVRCTAQARDAQRGVAQRRGLTAFRQSDPHFVWQLRTDLMELQCAQQAKHGLGYTLTGLGQTFAACPLGAAGSEAAVSSRACAHPSPAARAAAGPVRGCGRTGS